MESVEELTYRRDKISARKNKLQEQVAGLKREIDWLKKQEQDFVGEIYRAVLREKESAE